MQLYQEDIIQRREKNGRKTLWLSERLVLQVTETTEGYVRRKKRPEYLETIAKHRRKQNILPDSGASWRWAKMKGSFYYDYDRLPDQRRALLPSKEDLVKQYDIAMAKSRQSDLETRIKKALKKDYRSFISAYTQYNDTKCKALAKAAATLAAAADWIEEKEIPTTKSQFFKDLAKVVDDLGIQYVPRNYRRLKQKLVPVVAGEAATDIIDLPRAGNSNAQKFGDVEILSWLIQLRIHPANYTNEWIIRKLRLVCYLSNKDVPSRSWFATYLAQPKTKWLTQSRFGSGRHRNQYEGYVPLENAVYAGDCWQVDGTRVNFLPYRDEDGKDKYLYVVAVTDVYSGDLLGWHLDTKEDRWAYFNALRMAANLTGYLPYELVVDRFPGHQTQEWQLLKGRMEYKGVKVTVTSKKTGKAKVERLFGSLQSVFMQESEYYYGEGVQSSREAAHRSPEYLQAKGKEARRNGWDYNQAFNEAVRIFELYKNTAYCQYSRKFAKIEQSPAELHQESDKPHVLKVEPLTFAELFYLEKSVSIKRGMIRTEIQRMAYVYNVPDEIAHSVIKVRLMYDMEDLGKVYLFEDNDEINRQYYGQGVEQRRVQIYGPNAEFDQLAKAQKRIRDREEQRKAKLEEFVEAGSDIDTLLKAYSSKDDTASAETQWLNEYMNENKDTNAPRLTSLKPSEEVEDDGPDFSDEDLQNILRDQY